MRGLVKSRADLAGLAFLALLVLGSGALAILGYGAGLYAFVLLVGFLGGWVAAYFLTKPRRYRGWVSVALGVGVLLPYLLSIFGAVRGIEWLDLVGPYGSVRGALWFGLVLAVIQVVFGRSSGRGFWAED